MPGGEMKCLSPGTPPRVTCVPRTCADHKFELLPDAGTQQCQKLIRLNHLHIKSLAVRCDRVITADYLGSKGSNIIEEDITLRWGMNI